MTIDVLKQELRNPTTRILSLDVFDTVLLRDSSTESERLRQASRRAARRLGTDAAALTALRWLSHDNAYRAVAMERPDGDARFTMICEATVRPLGLGAEAAEVLRTVELATDASHLRPNIELLEAIREARASGIRIIAVSDIYYSADDLRVLFERVLHDQPFDEIYTSSDLGLTKHVGGIFPEVAVREGMSSGQDSGSIVHAGDTLGADVRVPRLFGWRAVHLPRQRAARVARIAGRVRSIPIRERRVR